jgi:membrane associated rhomboid family serine protease
MVIFSLSWVSIVAILAIIATLVFSYLKKIPMTFAIILANLIVFMISLFYTKEIIGELGFRPIYFSFEFAPQLYTLFTSMFVHGGFSHILGNMIVFFFMGLAFEHRIGSRKFLLIYFITGLFAAVFYSIFNLNSTVLLIGASGAIFGILGAFATAYPKDRVIMPIPVGIVFLAHIPVWVAAVMFGALETFYFAFVVGDNVAHLAHIGGIVCGVIISVFLFRGDRIILTSSTIEYQKPRSLQDINLGSMSYLRDLAKTPEQKQILEKIESEAILEVKKAWVEYFLKKSKCPRCGGKLSLRDRNISCKECGFKIKL